MRRQKNFGSSFAVNIRNISNKKPLLSSGFLFIAFENIFANRSKKKSLVILLRRRFLSFISATSLVSSSTRGTVQR